MSETAAMVLIIGLQNVFTIVITRLSIRSSCPRNTTTLHTTSWSGTRGLLSVAAGVPLLAKRVKDV